MAEPPASGDSLKTIVLAVPGIEVHVSPFGATLVKILVPDKHGDVDDVALGYDNFASYDGTEERPYFGAIVGRVANRIASAKFSLVDEDGVAKTYDTLVANNGPNCLHGGGKGFDRYWWTVASKSEDGTSVRLTRVSPNGEEGFPGQCAVDVEYRLEPDRSGNGNGATLHTTMTATVNQPCPVNLAQHTYFNLAGHNGGVGGDSEIKKGGGASGMKKITAMDHHLRVDADTYTPVDETCVPTGELVAVKSTPFDFTVMRKIGDLLPPKTIDDDPTGFDHNYALRRYNDDAKKKETHVCAEVFEPRSGRHLEVSCNTPGVQLYTGNFLGGGAHVGKNGSPYHKHQGLCLETQHFPDSVNQGDKFATCVLRPGQTYVHAMKHRFWATKDD
jgi:aldose 1-epimerase